jgi:glycosyltransferase involved in cell wall biosynthesis
LQQVATEKNITQSKKSIDLSVVIACYNEEPVLRGSISELIDVLDITRYRDSYELIFVDDVSRDSTLDIIRNLMQQYPQVNMRLIRHTQNTGRGRTVTDGLIAAQGRIAGFLDIDLETPAHYIPAAALEIERGADVVSALRIYKFVWRTFYRQVLSVGYHKLEASMLRVPLKDTEVGFKFFNRERALSVLHECKDPGWFWDTEVMARSYFSGLKIVEMPTLFIKRYDKKSSVRIFHDSFEYFQKLIKFRREAESLAAHYSARGCTPVPPSEAVRGRVKYADEVALV